MGLISRKSPGTLRPNQSSSSRPGYFSLIRRDTRRRVFRTVATLVAVALMIGALFSTMILTSGAAYSIQIARNKLGADIMVIPKGAALSPEPFYTLLYTPGPYYMYASVEQDVSLIPGVQAVTSQIFLTQFGAAGGDVGKLDDYIVAVESTNNFMLRGWLPSNVTNPPLANDTAVLGAGLPPWNTIPSHGGEFYGVKIKPEFTLAPTGTFLDHVIFVSMETAAKMVQWQMSHPGQGDPNWITPLGFEQGQISAVFVKVADGANPDLVVQHILTSVPDVQAFTFNSLVESANLRFSGLLTQFTISASLVWGGALLLVSATTSLSVNERRSEFGLFRAIGGTHSFVRRLVITQTVLVTGAAGCVGIAASFIAFYFFYTPIIQTIGVSYAVPPASQLATLVLLALAASAVTGIVAAYWPARVASRMEPYNALRAGRR